MNSVPLRLASRTILNARCKVCTQVRNSSAYKPDPNFKPPHLDDMPIPQGSWKALYDAKQKTYNLQLAIGLTLLTSTVGYILTSDRFFFNAFVPPLPEE